MLFSVFLAKKTENNIKSLNFFKNVNTQILDGENLNSKYFTILELDINKHTIDLDYLFNKF